MVLGSASAKLRLIALVAPPYLPLWQVEWQRWDSRMFGVGFRS